MKKKQSKEASPIPEELRDKFDAIVDKLIDSGRMTADQAVKEARTKLGLSEGLNRALRRGKQFNKDAVMKEIARQAARQAVKQIDAHKLKMLADEQGLKYVNYSAPATAEHQSNIGKLSKKLPIPLLGKFFGSRIRQEVGKKELTDFYYSQLPEYQKQLDRITDIHYRTRDAKQSRENRLREQVAKDNLKIIAQLKMLSEEGFI